MVPDQLVNIFSLFFHLDAAGGITFHKSQVNSCI